MYYKIMRLLHIIIITCFFLMDNFAQERYGFDSWPGKSGVIKNEIELPSQIISTHNLLLAEGSSRNSFFYKIPLDENDQIKKGRFQAEVFNTIEKAQLALVEYLDCLATPFKPTRLIDKDFKLGDVVYEKENDGILLIALSRNNVMIIVHATLNLAMEIIKEFDKNILNAPLWKRDSSKPYFLLEE